MALDGPVTLLVAKVQTPETADVDAITSARPHLANPGHVLAANKHGQLYEVLPGSEHGPSVVTAKFELLLASRDEQRPPPVHRAWTCFVCHDDGVIFAHAASCNLLFAQLPLVTGDCSPVFLFGKHSAEITCLAQGARDLVSGAADGSVKLWDPVLGQQLDEHRPSVSARVTAVTFIGPLMVAVGNEEGVVTVMDISERRFMVTSRFTVDSGPISCLAACVGFSLQRDVYSASAPRGPDGGGVTHGHVGLPWRDAPHNIDAASQGREGALLAVVSAGACLHVYQPAMAGEFAWRRTHSGALSGGSCHVEFSPEGRYLLTVSGGDISSSVMVLSPSSWDIAYQWRAPMRLVAGGFLPPGAELAVFAESLTPAVRLTMYACPREGQVTTMQCKLPLLPDETDTLGLHSALPPMPSAFTHRQQAAATLPTQQHTQLNATEFRLAPSGPVPGTGADLPSSFRQGTILGPTPVLSPVRNPYDALRPAAAAAAAAAAGTATAAAAGLSMPLSDRPGVTGTNTEYTLHERGPEGLGSTMAALRAALKPSTLPVGRSWLTDQPPPEPDLSDVAPLMDLPQPHNPADLPPAFQPSPSAHPTAAAPAPTRTSSAVTTRTIPRRPGGPSRPQQDSEHQYQQNSQSQTMQASMQALQQQGHGGIGDTNRGDGVGDSEEVGGNGEGQWQTRESVQGAGSGFPRRAVAGMSSTQAPGRYNSHMDASVDYDTTHTQHTGSRQTTHPTPDTLHTQVHPRTSHLTQTHTEPQPDTGLHGEDEEGEDRPRALPQHLLSPGLSPQPYKLASSNSTASNTAVADTGPGYGRVPVAQHQGDFEHEGVRVGEGPQQQQGLVRTSGGNGDVGMHSGVQDSIPAAVVCDESPSVSRARRGPDAPPRITHAPQLAAAASTAAASGESPAATLRRELSGHRIPDDAALHTHTDTATTADAAQASLASDPNTDADATFATLRHGVADITDITDPSHPTTTTQSPHTTATDAHTGARHNADTDLQQGPVPAPGAVADPATQADANDGHRNTADEHDGDYEPVPDFVSAVPRSGDEVGDGGVVSGDVTGSVAGEGTSGVTSVTLRGQGGPAAVQRGGRVVNARAPLGSRRRAPAAPLGDVTHRVATTADGEGPASPAPLPRSPYRGYKPNMAVLLKELRARNQAGRKSTQVTGGRSDTRGALQPAQQQPAAIQPAAQGELVQHTGQGSEPGSPPRWPVAHVSLGHSTALASPNVMLGSPISQIQDDTYQSRALDQPQLNSTLALVGRMEQLALAEAAPVPLSAQQREQAVARAAQRTVNIPPHVRLYGNLQPLGVPAPAPPPVKQLHPSWVASRAARPEISTLWSAQDQQREVCSTRGVAQYVRPRPDMVAKTVMEAAGF